MSRVSYLCLRTEQTFHPLYSTQPSQGPPQIIPAGLTCPEGPLPRQPTLFTTGRRLSLLAPYSSVFITVCRTLPLKDTRHRFGFTHCNITAENSTNVYFSLPHSLFPSVFSPSQGASALFDMIEYYESATHLNISFNKHIGTRGWQAAAHMMRKVRGFWHSLFLQTVHDLQLFSFKSILCSITLSPLGIQWFCIKLAVSTPWHAG